MRNMIAGEVPLTTNVMREIQEPEQQAETRECTKTPEVVLQLAAAPDSRRRRTSAIPDFEQTFMTPMEIIQRAASMSASESGARFWKSSRRSAENI